MPEYIPNDLVDSSGNQWVERRLTRDGREVLPAPGGGLFLIEDAETGLPTRPEDPTPKIWITWTDPVDQAAEYDLFIAVPEPS